MQISNRRDEESKGQIVDKRKKGDGKAGVPPKKNRSSQNDEE
jgi:hypothetical protein